MAEIRFSSKAHRDFFVEMMGKCRKMTPITGLSSM